MDVGGESSTGGAAAGDAPEPTDDGVVGAAAEAAEDVIFSRYRSAEIRDLDVTVRFSEGRLEVDVYLNVPDAEDAEQVAEDAARAARDAVDELFS